VSAGRAGRWLAIAASVVVVVALAAGLLTIGSPDQQRESRLDRKREQDLRAIARAIDRRTKAGRPLPTSLDIMAAEPGQRLSVTDPASGAPYVYQTTGNDGYRLCAVFGTDTASPSRLAWVDEDWLHGSGRYCFDRKAEREKG
jgi:type II secretory pathway pseudopilin PulG